jgi:hypothetical protein
MFSSQPPPIRFSERAILDDETLLSLLDTTMVGHIGVLSEGDVL